MKLLLTGLALLACFNIGSSQALSSPCSNEAILGRHLEMNPNALIEIEKTELELQSIIEELRQNQERTGQSTYVIPVVMHVFHFGDLGKMDMEQALSGLEILNNDFNGLNDDWNNIITDFDQIKSSLDITFCLATLDPEGNSTTGLIYYEDEDAVYNQGDLFQHAWDNYKYLNIYFPKYTQGGPSDFTAYAYYPSTSNTNNNVDGIFYSSIRWGYGNHSELELDDEWASVCTHEAGHWLNLRHTFQGGCADGDLVNDTPPTLNNGIELAGCFNNDSTCNVPTNGENYMDYNHRCKKMFTEGQVERMIAALHLPSRINLWTEENLLATGCENLATSIIDESASDMVSVYPNPASDDLTIDSKENNVNFHLYSLEGQLLRSYFLKKGETRIPLHNYSEGIYFFSTYHENDHRTGKLVICRD